MTTLLAPRIPLLLALVCGCAAENEVSSVSDAATPDADRETGSSSDTRTAEAEAEADVATDADKDVADSHPDTAALDSDTASDASEVDGFADHCGELDAGITPEPGWTCCAIGAPSCSGTATGGSPDQPGGCHSVADSPPVGWERCFDKHGCPFWKPAAGSCLKPDAATDG